MTLRSMAFSFLSVGVILSLVASPVNAAPDDLLSHFQSKDSAVRQKAIEQIQEDRKKLEQDIRGLAEVKIKEAEDAYAAWFHFIEENPNAKESPQSQEMVAEYREKAATAGSIVGLLGSLRDKASVPFLIKHLGFRNRNESDKYFLDNAFPCMGALINIGLPSLDPLVENLLGPKEANSYHSLYPYVFVNVLDGSNAASAFMDDRAQQEKDPLKKQILETYAKRFKDDLKRIAVFSRLR